MLLSCRTIAAEARPVFYTVNLWTEYDDPVLHRQNPAAELPTLRSWLSERGGGRHRMFREVHVYPWLEHLWHEKADQEAVAREI